MRTKANNEKVPKALFFEKWLETIANVLDNRIQENKEHLSRSTINGFRRVSNEIRDAARLIKEKC